MSNNETHISLSNSKHNIHTLQSCIVNAFQHDADYLKNCCYGNEPYISEFVKKRCDELHISLPPVQTISARKSEIIPVSNAN